MSYQRCRGRNAKWEDATNTARRLTHGLRRIRNKPCNELEIAAAHCERTGQLLVVGSDKAQAVCQELQGQRPGLRLRADVGAWRRSVATSDSPLENVETLFGLPGWCEDTFPASAGIEAYTPSRFLLADDREALRALLKQTEDLPPNIITRIAIEAQILEANRRQDFHNDLAQTRRRRFAFVFAAKRDPLAKYQRLDGLRRLLAECPESEIDHVDPLVAADALAHGAVWVGVGVSSSRRMPTRPGDKGGPLAVGYLPGLFLEELLELRSPRVYADWYANARSPYCRTCARPLDVFEPTAADMAAIATHNVHQAADHIADLCVRPYADRQAWLRDKRLEAHARHMALNPLGAMELNRNLHRFLELDDPALRSMTRAGAWQ